MDGLKSAKTYMNLSVLKNICWNSWWNMRKTKITLEESPVFNRKYIDSNGGICSIDILVFRGGICSQIGKIHNWGSWPNIPRIDPIGPWHFHRGFWGFNACKISRKWMAKYHKNYPLKIWSCEKTWTFESHKCSQLLPGELQDLDNLDAKSPQRFSLLCPQSRGPPAKWLKAGFNPAPRNCSNYSKRCATNKYA